MSKRPAPTPVGSVIGLGHRFADPTLLETALTHPSYAAEAHVPSNQRLEFLGDAVLKLLVAELLYSEFPDWPEGSLSPTLGQLVGNAHIAGIARAMGLGDAMRVGRGAARDGTRTREKVLADCLEALIGAVYLDGGYGAVRAEFAAAFTANIASIDAPAMDAKSRLQAREQKAGRPVPRYRDVGSTGDDHALQWRVELLVGSKVYGPASASTKAAAEVALAVMALADSP